MPRKLDLTGHTYGHLRVIEEDPDDPRPGTVWRCQCVCGKVVSAMSGRLRLGILHGARRVPQTSCGCMGRIAKNWKKHGHRPAGKRSRTYISWQAMKRRCGDVNFIQWKDYGGRGVRVCSRWMESFDAFLADMGERPSGKTLDRIDTNGNYEPGNCKWSTPLEQSSNRRKSRLSAT